MSVPQHPDPKTIAKGARLWHIATRQWVSLCNCASVSDYRKISWARAHPSEYYVAQPVAEGVVNA
jgi:hypothetical protein